jgi:hypothetical protein
MNERYAVVVDDKGREEIDGHVFYSGIDVDFFDSLDEAMKTRSDYITKGWVNVKVFDRTTELESA